jgi:UDP-N-acetylglucosamine 2-epimerase (non-hydrolysing)
VDAANIHITGNTVIDSLLDVAERVKSDARVSADMASRFDFLQSDKSIILVTGHRRENFGSGFENICHALREIAGRSDVQVVFPVHLNWNVQQPVQRILSGVRQVHLIPPQDYLPFVYLMQRCQLVITDSGGVHEEALAG